MRPPSHLLYHCVTWEGGMEILSDFSMKGEGVMKKYEGCS